jgi:hypothetical protein
MNKSEACEWVHTQLIVAEMPFDDLVAAFTALVGRAPNEPDRREGLFRRCYQIVTSQTGVSHAQRTTVHARPRNPSPN